MTPAEHVEAAEGALADSDQYPYGAPELGQCYLAAIAHALLALAADRKQPLVVNVHGSDIDPAAVAAALTRKAAGT